MQRVAIQIELIPSKHCCSQKFQAFHEEATIANLLDATIVHVLYLNHQNSTMRQACTG